MGNADGLTVTFRKTVAGYADKIDNCRIISAFGVGSSDRIVLSGNSAYPARDWISAMGDPTYFPDLGYSVVGLEDVPIVGYCRVGDCQAVVKKDNGQDASVFFRSGELTDEGEARFPLKQAVSGVGGVSEGGFANLLKAVFHWDFSLQDWKWPQGTVRARGCLGWLSRVRRGSHVCPRAGS